MDARDQLDLVTAARAVARAGLSDAFGHVSMRIAHDAATITPPIPLAEVVHPDQLLRLPFDDEGLPAGVPREAWLHVAILSGRPELGAICRAQPPALAAWAALHRPLPVTTGHVAMLGPIAEHTDSRLVRDLGSARNAADALGDSCALILRGNGALTVGTDLPSAVAAMWVLERGAELALRSAAAGLPHDLPPDQQSWWRERADELLPRIYRHISREEPT